MDQMVTNRLRRRRTAPDQPLPFDTVCSSMDRGPRVGIAPAYGTMVLDNSLSLIARLTTVDEIASIWKS